MGNFMIENDALRVTAASHGAELVSIYDKEKAQEYLWNGDEKYWPRRAPVLFPFVGQVKNKQYTYNGKTYAMGQHGFARDMEFDCTRQEKDCLWFRLCSDESTLERYPFAFCLDIGYELRGRELKVLWKVTNPSDETMYFSIGAHPAFMCPLKDDEKQTDYFIDFHTQEDISYNLIKQDGLVGIYDERLALDGGVCSIDAHMFDRDALIVENGQSHSVSLLDSSRLPYVTVDFDAPLFGIWSPTGKNAPFVCIEPWYGRCDAVDFEGSLKDRAYGQILEGKQVFSKDYVIRIH